MESPWVEKYRPAMMNDIALSKYNRAIINSITTNRLCVNVMLYGPPGTGKTTTALNIIESFREGDANSGLVMHLNASDERGIDIIRTQLNNFVHANNMFTKGKKIVVMDEADYLTKFAQNALKFIIDESIMNVQFILICNYITRIDKSLQNIFLKIRFDSVPRSCIFKRLRKICDVENVRVSSRELFNVIDYYDTDIRSMINHMQYNKSDIRGTSVSMVMFNRLVRAASDGADECALALIPRDICPHDFWSSIYCIMIKKYDYVLPYIPSIREIIYMDIDATRWNRAALALFVKIVKAGLN